MVAIKGSEDRNMEIRTERPDNHNVNIISCNDSVLTTCKMMSATSPQTSRNNKRERSMNECLASNHKSNNSHDDDDCGMWRDVWRDKFVQEERKNIELQLQMCFIRGEYFRMLGAQHDITTCLGKLQVVYFIAIICLVESIS